MTIPIPNIDVSHIESVTLRVCTLNRVNTCTILRVLHVYIVVIVVNMFKVTDRVDEKWFKILAVKVEQPCKKVSIIFILLSF